MKFYHIQACDLLQGLIPTKEEKSSLSKDHYERLYVFTVMWCIGSFLELDDRAKLEEFIRKGGEVILNLPEIPADSDQAMFDYLVDADGRYNSCRVEWFFLVHSNVT